jgi:transposase
MAMTASATSPLCGPGDVGARISKGRELAAHPEEIVSIGKDDWSVPSQSGFGRYRVWFPDGRPRCGCSDFASRAQETAPMPCKHIFAVIELQRRASGDPTGSPVPSPRKQYPQHPTYTRAQSGEMRLVDSLLRELVDSVPDLPRTPGVPGPKPTPLRDELYCAILKVYSGLSGRRAVGVYANVADRALLSRAPSYAVASNLLTRPEVTPILYRLLAMTAAPLASLEDGGVVAPDSTGVQTTSFGGWREAKHGEKRRKRWLKVHAMVGTRTHVVIRALVTEENTADSPTFGPLLRETIEAGFRPSRVVADKGYLSQSNYAEAAAVGVDAYIPFKRDTVSNEVRRIRGTPAPPSWEKAYHLFQANRQEFNRNYHRRSNVESVFSALKRKFGENVRSRTEAAQTNEIICKLICYNLTVVVHEMFENGIAPSFSGPTSRRV